MSTCARLGYFTEILFVVKQPQHHDNYNFHLCFKLFMSPWA